MLLVLNYLGSVCQWLFSLPEQFEVLPKQEYP